MNKEKEKERVVEGRSLIDVIFSWSVKDVRNHHIYKNQVKQIPKIFSYTEEYLTSFTIPLIEETRADMSSCMDTLARSPCRRIRSFKRTKDFKSPKDLFYSIVLKPRMKDENYASFYEPEIGDLIAITSVRPRKAGDLDKHSVIAYVQYVMEDSPTMIVLLSKTIPAEEYTHVNERSPNLFVTFLVNMTTNVRIWEALTSGPTERNMKLIQKVLQPRFMEEGKCNLCPTEEGSSNSDMEFRNRTDWSGLNESQQNAVMSCIGSRNCEHEGSIKLVWGPPGTGKTNTVGFMLHSLLAMKRRTLTCAPTNVAILEVTERLVKRVMSSENLRGYGLRDVVLFGNGERMKIDDRDELKHVFLDHRIKILHQCFAGKTGWSDCLRSVISLLEDPLALYDSYLQDEAGKRLLGGDSESDSEDERERKIKADMRFDHLVAQLSFCIHNLCKHLPSSVISPQEMQIMFDADKALKSLLELLCRVEPEELKYIFAGLYSGNDGGIIEARNVRLRSLRLLRLLPPTFPAPFPSKDRKEAREFLLANACLVFCTVSSSAKLHVNGVSPWDLLIIDEAAQLKECESTTPLQLPGIFHAVLIGDERQLPAMVKSKICEEVDFGRSLFERLASLGHKKHLLNVQHRMHPSISLFPNKEFYEGKILDGQNVRLRSHNKQFLQGKMFDSYSFINVMHGSEAVGNNHSTRNMVEASVVSEIVARLYKEMNTSKKKVRVGVISPYKAQVYAITEKLGKSYSSDPRSEFSVSVRSVDGFQGGEEDVIIISTVRSSFGGSVGFLSNCQRTNVALTRARHCLWIVGNGSTLSKSRSVWQKLVDDAKERRCFHEADEDKGLARAMVVSLVELNQIPASRDLISLLFQDSKWTVRFDEAFWTLMARVGDSEYCKEVLLMVEKLSGGWRTGQSAKVVEKYLVKQRFLVWGVDIERKISLQTQFLKVYAVLEPSEVPNLSIQLNEMYGSYSPAKLRRCKHRRIEGDLVVPMTWPADSVDNEADPLNFLSKPLASLRLRDEAETSSA